MRQTVRAFRSARPRSMYARTSRARCRTRSFPRILQPASPQSSASPRSFMRHPSFLAFGAFCALGLLGSVEAAAQPARLERTDLPPSAIALTDLRAFRPTSANWRIAGDASADRARPLALVAEPGTGVLVNVPTDAAKGHLLTTWEHGDLDLSLDVMLPKTSNSGVYLMGRYEVQLFDSWGVRTPTFADMGGIYQRWDESRGAGREGYEGTAPALNASRAPGPLAASRDRVPRAEVRGEAQGRQRAIPPRRPQRRHRAGERRGHRSDARRAVHRRARDRSADDPGRSRSRRRARHRVQVVHRRGEALRSQVSRVGRRGNRHDVDDDASADARGHGRDAVVGAGGGDEPVRHGVRRLAHRAGDGTISLHAQHRLGGHRSGDAGTGGGARRSRHRRQAGDREPRRTAGDAGRRRSHRRQARLRAVVLQEPPVRRPARREALDRRARASSGSRCTTRAC